MSETAALERFVGRRFGTAVAVRLIGAGGMGAVFEAEQPLLGRRLAVKVILPEMSRNPAAVDRFLQEARVVASVEHPRLVSIVDCGYSDDGLPYLTMPLLDGRDLLRFSEEVGAALGHPGRLPVETAAPLFLQILAGLAVIHDRGIVHRDLKGANLFVILEGNTETIKILDFGIAKLFDPSLRVAAKTTTFQMIGSPGYMAPEQARNGPIDYRTDLWAAGAVFFRALTGRLPFEGSDPVEIAAKAMLTPPPTVTELVPTVPIQLSKVILSCLAPEPGHRPDSARMLAGQIMEALTELMDGYALAERVAPDLLSRSRPSDPTIRRRAVVSQGAPGPVAAGPSLGSGSAAGATRSLAGPRPVPAVEGGTPAGRRGGRGRSILVAGSLVVVGAGLGLSVMLFANQEEASERTGQGEGSQVLAHGEPRVAPGVVPGPVSAGASGVAAPEAGPTRKPGTESGADAARTDAGAALSDAGAAPAALTPTSAAAAERSAAAEQGRTRGRRENGTLVITSKPFADVWIDGKPSGSTPASRELPVGRHRVRLVGPQGKSETVRVQVRAGKTTRLEHLWSQE